MHSLHKYQGYLKQLPDAPDPEAVKDVPQVVFSPESIEKWKCTDDPGELEWTKASAWVGRTDGGSVLLHSDFAAIRRIDNLDRKKPRFWAPLSVTSEEDPRFPLDCRQFPVVEITYRCVTSHACPACVWTYPGGAHQLFLEPSRDWLTAIMLIPHHDFPASISRFTLRLYSAWRSKEVLEIAQVRFRGLLPTETSALAGLSSELGDTPAPPAYPLLDTFLPFGVHMHATVAEQLAELMDISLFDYLRLAFEDVVRHHHNCIVFEGAHTFSQETFNVVVELAENFGVRLIPAFDWPLEMFAEKGDDLIDSYIKPHTQSNGILAWNLMDTPFEQNLAGSVRARNMIAAADPNHPMAVQLGGADAFPLFSPHFAASGFSYFRPREPWAIAETLRTHIPLLQGQQFWVTAPAFVYASDYPPWGTSPQLRLMLNSALAGGARGWIAHTYHNTPVWVEGHYERSLTGPFLTFSDLWAELGNRVERLTVLAPLFLSARPIPPPEHLQFSVGFKKNPKSRLLPGLDAISVSWLQGPDYLLFYLVNNDTEQVTSVNLSLPASLPDGLEVYETTALVRNRTWEPSLHKRQSEMFPGQGRLFMVAQPGVCEFWHHKIAQRIIQKDLRQTRMDLELARQYRLEVEFIETTLNHLNTDTSIADLNPVHDAREALFNLIYATPEICRPRELLIQASSVICGCDGALSALHGRGDAATARELGIQVLPLARTLTVLRLQLRRGHGSAIVPEIEALVRTGTELLKAIWEKRG